MKSSPTAADIIALSYSHCTIPGKHIQGCMAIQRHSGRSYDQTPTGPTRTCQLTQF